MSNDLIQDSEKLRLAKEKIDSVVMKSYALTGKLPATRVEIISINSEAEGAPERFIKVRELFTFNPNSAHMKALKEETYLIDDECL